MTHAAPRATVARAMRTFYFTLAGRTYAVKASTHEAATIKAAALANSAKRAGAM